LSGAAPVSLGGSGRGEDRRDGSPALPPPNEPLKPSGRAGTFVSRTRGTKCKCVRIDDALMSGEGFCLTCLTASNFDFKGWTSSCGNMDPEYPARS
jgi:hypothetical protein